MRDAAVHRGPDDAGAVALPGVVLGHRRLAIIDLSPGGHQPLMSSDGRFALSYNGEIYNYAQLRASLRTRWRFRSNCDTEVLLAAWATWGATCVSRLRGMFAFALWDAQERALYLVRDRFGIKPLFYAETPYGLLFGSEIRQLAAAGIDLSPNTGVLYDFLEKGLLEGGDQQTFHKEIFQVPPATLLRWCAGSSRLSRYYDLGLDTPSASSATDLGEELEEAVKLHMQSDVPVGSCLSGGLDSSTLVAVADRVRSNDNYAAVVITAGCEQEELDERVQARAVARHLGLEWIEVVPAADELISDLSDLIRFQEQPFGGTGVYAQWCVMRAAAQCGLKVMLDGQGADELLGGYLRHRIAWSKDLFRKGRLGQALRLFDGATSGGADRYRCLLAAALPFHKSRALLAAYRGEPLEPLAGPALTGRTTPRRRSIPFRSHFDFERRSDLAWRTLPGLLRYEDRNSMAFSIEARVPYLDHVFAEHALAVSGDDAFRGGFSKAPLRRLAAQFLPADIAYHPNKLGFATSESLWFQGRLGELAHEVLSDGSVRDRGLVQPDKALTALKRAQAGGNTTKLWRALSVALWDGLVVRARFGDGKSSSFPRPLTASAIG